MANEGATTVGSIDAKVSMDLDQWRRDVAEVQASARELGAVSPTITVEANTSRAEAEMAAVDAAAAAMGVSATTSAQAVSASATKVDTSEARVAAAMKAAETAAARAELAQLRLDEAQGSTSTSASRLLAAQIAVSEAQNRAENAARKAAEAQAALSASQQAATASAAEEAGAEDGNAAAITRTGTAASGASGRVQLIVAAVAAVIALAGPLTAAAVGIAGGLAGMGAAGVLAIVGIVKAMKDGTLAGEEYGAGLKTLKGDLNELASTAANGFLRDFQRGVDLIQQDMPALNSEIRGFTSILGGAGLSALQAVLNVFRVLNPLFVQGATVIKNIADGFDQWTQGGGLEQFAAYAGRELPIVVKTLGDLGNAVVHIVEAFAPIGNTVLGALDAVAQVINGIPVPVLTQTATAALLVWAAFKTWQGISGIVTKASSAVSKFGQDTASSKAGALGLAGAVVGANIAINNFAIDMARQGNSGLLQWEGHTRSVEQWSDAVSKGNVKINNLSGLLASSSGFWNDLQRNTDLFGSTMQTLSSSELPKLDQAMSQASPKKMTAAWAQLTEEAKKQGVSQDDLKAKFPLTTAALQAQGDAAEDTKGDLDKTVYSVDDLKTAEDKARDATDKFSQALRDLGGANLDADQANIQYQQSLADLTESVKENGKGLDETTDSGRKNMSALDDIATSAKNLIAAQADQGASEQTLQGNMAASRQAFINAAEAAGATADQANQLADKYGLIPSEVATAFKTSGAQDAIDKAQQIKNQLDQIPRALNIAVNLYGAENIATTGGRKVAFAGGGTVSGPGSRTADRIDASLSDTEEVTSNDRGQADKWRPLLKMVNADAPAGQIAGRAMQIAGAAPTAVAAAGPAAVHNHYWTVYSNNADQLYQDFTRKTNAKVGP